MENKFDIKLINVSMPELAKVGFDKTYINYAVRKHNFLSLKICDLNCAQANILKQTAIASGTDCAVNKEVITGSIEKSDCILSGSISELTKIAEKLSYQPFGMKKLGEQIVNIFSIKPQSLFVGEHNFDWTQPIIMGILNVTPDSFSDGGDFLDVKQAVEHYKQLVQDGADIIDIGGESTRPNAVPISADEECERVIPVLKAIRKFDSNTIISIDTRNAKTAEQAIDNGADIINDISGLEWDNSMLTLLKLRQKPIILTHSQDVTNVDDVVDTIYNYFKQKIKLLIENNIPAHTIILDPGIGFGKTQEQNLEIIKRIKEFKTINSPILVGHSRKSFIQNQINSNDNEILDDATLLISQKLVDDGVNVLRVHNVKKHSIIKKSILK